MANTRISVLDRDDFDSAHGFDELLREFRHHRRSRGLSISTIALNLHHIEQLQRTHPDILSVTTVDLEEYLSMRRHSLAPESRKSMRNSRRAFFAWALDREHLEVNPAAKLRPVRLSHRVARIAPDEAIVTSLETVSLRDKAMILLGRLAALRLSEITRLHTEDREGDVLRVHGKGDRTRMVPINAELLDVLVRLEHLQGAHGFYFRGTGAREGSHMHPITVSKIISAATGWNPHSLRHAAATAAYEGTHDLRAVQEMLGHQNLMTTQRYVHVRADHIRAAVDATSLGLAGGVTTAIERTG